MEKPDTTTKALILSSCFGAICASPEAWRAFEHEQKEDESFEDWALNRAGIWARKIWKRANRHDNQSKI